VLQHHQALLERVEAFNVRGLHNHRSHDFASAKDGSTLLLNGYSTRMMQTSPQAKLRS